MNGPYCRRDDVFIGYGAAGVFRPPAGKTRQWLASHCWVCHRSTEEIMNEEAAENRVRFGASDLVASPNEPPPLAVAIAHIAERFERQDALMLELAIPVRLRALIWETANRQARASAAGADVRSPVDVARDMTDAWCAGLDLGPIADRDGRLNAYERDAVEAFRKSWAAGR